jgi:cytochrome c biogenesis protein ResB
MNTKYKKPSTIAVRQGDFRKPGRLINAAAVLIIVASIFQITMVAGFVPSSHVTTGCTAAPAASGQASGSCE